LDRQQRWTAYITVDLHQENNRDPFVYKTADFGKTWKDISATIPKSPLSYAHCIKEDPSRQGMLYLGTENGLYVSFNDGETWQPLQNNLPRVPVYGITVQEHFKDLIIATYGRGFWILDDIAPLRQMSPNVVNADAHLFAPRPAYRFRGTTPPMAVAYDATDGQNPPYGADINYYLKSIPEGDVRITIIDEKGQTIRTIPGTKNAGINRVWWDLRGAPSPEIVLRTSPIYASWMRVGPKGRPIGGRLSLLAPPGAYKVKLTVGGQQFTQPLAILKDPHSSGTEADIRSQYAFLQGVQTNLKNVGEMINQVETLRKQTEDLKNASNASSTQVRNTAGVLDQKLTEFEENLYQLRITGGQDGMRWPGKIEQKLGHIASELQDADFPPTSQQLAVNREYTEQIREWQSQFKQLLSNDVAEFNNFLRAQNLPSITVSNAAGSQR
jgi:hypothetical protein